MTYKVDLHTDKKSQLERQETSRPTSSSSKKIKRRTKMNNNECLADFFYRTKMKSRNPASSIGLWQSSAKNPAHHTIKGPFA